MRSDLTEELLTSIAEPTASEQTRVLESVRRRHRARHLKTGLLGVACLVAIASVGVVAVANRANDRRSELAATSPSTTLPSVVTLTTLGQAPSQSPGDAARDGVVPAVAALAAEQRISILSDVADGGERWVISQTPSSAYGPNSVLGDPNGSYRTDYVYAGDAELLQLDVDGAIIRAYPMAGANPSWLYVTEDSVYAGRIGDGAQPYSSFVRISRNDGNELVIVVDPIYDDFVWPEGWSAASIAQLEAIMRAPLFGTSDQIPDGTPVESWDTPGLVVDLAGVDRLFDELGGEDPAPVGTSHALGLLLGGPTGILEGTPLRLGNTTIVRTLRLADEPSQWVINVDDYEATFAGLTGAVDVLSYLDGRTLGVDLEIVAGPHDRCEELPPLVDPPDIDGFGYRQISIVPTDANSCADWFAIDLFFSDFVYEVRLDLGQGEN